MALKRDSINSGSLVKAVYSVNIDLNQSMKREFGIGLIPGGTYFFKNKIYSDNNETSYEDLENFITEIIEEELKDKCQKYLSNNIVAIEVTDIFNGSIEIIFTVILSVFQVISGIKDIYDSISLIRKIAEKHIIRRLAERYGNNFTIEVFTEIPNHRYTKYSKWIGNEHDGRINTVLHKQRDGLFYYLLISNIILLIILGIMVFKAVVKMYW